MSLGNDGVWRRAPAARGVSALNAGPVSVEESRRVTLRFAVAAVVVWAGTGCRRLHQAQTPSGRTAIVLVRESPPLELMEEEDVPLPSSVPFVDPADKSAYVRAYQRAYFNTATGLNIPRRTTGPSRAFNDVAKHVWQKGLRDGVRDALAQRRKQAVWRWERVGY